MSFIIKINYSGSAPPVMKRTFNKMKKEAFRLVGEFWHAKMRPKHFRNSATREYGYKKRSGERGSGVKRRFENTYTGKKLAKFGHTRPLVWTGESRDRTANLNVKSTSKQVRIIMRAPALSFINKHSEINMRKELTTISPGELVELSANFKTSISRLIRRSNKKITKKIT